MKPWLRRETVVFIVCFLAVLTWGCNEPEPEVADEAYGDTLGKEGDFESPQNQVLQGMRLVPLPGDPAVIECPGQYVIIAHRWSTPASCDGFIGPGSPLVQMAEQDANGLAFSVTCPDGCERTQETIWRAWMCGHNQDRTRNEASGFAEVKVACTPE